MITLTNYFAVSRCRLLILALAAGALSGLVGCKTPPLTEDKHPSGAKREIRQAAVASYLYAQMAQNAYSSEEFTLPSYVTEMEPKVDNPKTGFAMRTYRVEKPAFEPLVVIAFRGTQFSSIADWAHGNMTDTQYREGLDHVRRIRAKLPAGTRLILTGHSLGGAIATSVSLNEENLSVYAFDASPRLHRGRAVHNPDRNYISQHAEILAFLRKLAINPYGTYTTINCGIGGSPVQRHSMRALANCLTKIAAWDDESALRSCEVNDLGSRERIFR